MGHNIQISFLKDINGKNDKLELASPHPSLTGKVFTLIKLFCHMTGCNLNYFAGLQKIEYVQERKII